MQASPIARAACVVYGMLLLYSGLAPWSGWRDLGIDAWAYLTAPAPHYITTFDLVANVLAYLPFGALIVLAVHPRMRGLGAIALGTLGGAVPVGLDRSGADLPSDAHCLEHRPADQHTGRARRRRHRGAADVHRDRPRSSRRLAPTVVRAACHGGADGGGAVARSPDLSGADAVRQWRAAASHSSRWSKLSAASGGCSMPTASARRSSCSRRHSSLRPRFSLPASRCRP